MKKTFPSLIIILFVLLSCTNEESITPQEIVEIDKIYQTPEENIALESSPETEKKIKPIKVRQKKKTKQINLCKGILKSLNQKILRISRKAAIGPRIKRSKLAKIVNLDPKYCQKTKSRISVLKYVKDELYSHRSKVGVVLPLTGPDHQIGKLILKGLQSAASDSKIDFEELFIVEDSKSSPQGAGQALLKLLFDHRTSITIGGATKMELKELSLMSENLLSPLISLNGHTQTVKESKYVFQTFPNQDHQADRLAKAIAQRGYKKIAILNPQSGKSQTLIDQLTKRLNKHGVTVQQNIPYLSGSFPSMNEAIIKFAGLEYSKRKVEYQALTRQLIKKAKDTGTKFRHESVILPPKLESQALFIPDNFRIVRHFIKLLKFHEVRKVPLIGTHEWRSFSLIQPWDSFLDGSIFADFVGNYAQLPSSIQPPEVQQKYFISATHAMDLDLKMIGYYAGTFALDAIGNQVEKRKEYIRVLSDLRSRGGFFQNRKIFTGKGTSMWPVFLFSINRSGLTQF